MRYAKMQTSTKRKIKRKTLKARTNAGSGATASAQTANSNIPKITGHPLSIRATILRAISQSCNAIFAFSQDTQGANAFVNSKE